jgi:5-methylcytosine-specific restriction endonuclease McrA
MSRHRTTRPQVMTCFRKRTLPPPRHHQRPDTMWTHQGGHKLPQKTKNAILNRDHHQCVHTTGGQRCPNTTHLEIDHITPHHLEINDHPTNLQTLCHTHHQAKTNAEAQAARTAWRRPPRPHPSQTRVATRRST